MPIEDFIIAVFCCVEQCLQEISGKHPLRQRGFSPQCSDSEVLTGRTFQLGEGWHSNENAVRFWNP